MVAVTAGIAVGQPKPGQARRVQLAIHLDSIGGEGYGASTDVIDEQMATAGPSGDIAFAGLPRDIDLGSVELATVDGKPAPAIAEQRFWPADDSPESHLLRQLGSPVTVTTTRGEVVGLLRAVDGDSIAVEVGKELRILRRGAFVQDVRFASSQWRPTGMLTWRFVDEKTATPRMLGVRYRTSQITATTNLSAMLDEARRTIDVSALVTLHNGTGVDFGPAQVTVFTEPTSDPVAPLPNAIPLAAAADVTVALFPALRKVSVTPIVIVESSLPLKGIETERECGVSQSTADGMTAQGYEFVAAPNTILPRSAIRLTTANQLPVDDDVTLEIANGRGLLVRGTAPIEVEHQQVDCTTDEKANALRETISLTVRNTGKAAMQVELREPMERSLRWKVERSSEPIAERTTLEARFRINVPANAEKQVTYTVVYSW